MDDGVVPRSRRRVYRNVAEQAFVEFAARNGWEVTKRGWPDFLCFGPRGETIAVEVKPRMTGGTQPRPLKREQRTAMDVLSRAGIPCFVSDGERLVPYKVVKRTGRRH